MKIVATTKIDCPNSSKGRHAVTLHADGSVTCDCADGRERGASLAGRMMLGLPPIDGARGCGALVALVDGAASLLPLVRGSWLPDYGAWAELMFAYGKNPVFRAALDQAERVHEPARPALRQLVLEYIERAGYRHSLGKRRFREEFKALWDVPVDGNLDRFLVSAFDDDPWRVPYMVGWKEQIADEGLALVDGQFVCARSPEDPSILWAITFDWNGGEAHWVRPHRLGRDRRLKEVA